MKKIVTLLFVTIFISAATAQTLDVKWGKNFKKDGTKEDEYGDCQFAFSSDSKGELVYVARSVFDKCKELFHVSHYENRRRIPRHQMVGSHQGWII